MGMTCLSNYFDNGAYICGKCGTPFQLCDCVAPTDEEFLCQRQCRANEISDYFVSLILQDDNVATLAYQYHFIYLKSRKFPQSIASSYTQALNNYLPQYCDYKALSCELDSLVFDFCKDVIGLPAAAWDVIAQKIYEHLGEHK